MSDQPVVKTLRSARRSVSGKQDERNRRQHRQHDADNAKAQADVGQQPPRPAPTAGSLDGCLFNHANAARQRWNLRFRSRAWSPLAIKEDGLRQAGKPYQFSPPSAGGKKGIASSTLRSPNHPRTRAVNECRIFRCSESRHRIAAFTLLLSFLRERLFKLGFVVFESSTICLPPVAFPARLAGVFSVCADPNISSCAILCHLESCFDLRLH